MLIKVAAGVWWYEGEDEVEEGALEQTADINDLQVICAQTATNYRSFGSGVIFAYLHAHRPLMKIVILWRMCNLYLWQLIKREPVLNIINLKFKIRMSIFFNIWLIIWETKLFSNWKCVS